MTNAVDMLALLAETTAASSLAILLVLVLRRPLRNHFGVAAGYGLWALVPAALVAVLLPAAAIAPVPALTVLTPGSIDVQTLAMAASAPVDIAIWLCALWLLGVVAVALRFARQQHAFRRALGTLQARGRGLFAADATAGLPAAIGLWRPMIVLPADFETRYTPEQRALMQAHERSHIVRGDLQLNALVAALRCLFWFNPLLHAAARCFRHDQELACDQRVIARHPQSRRAYGEAMFHTQLAAQPLPLGCHWGLTHPLKERIAMLRQPVPSKARWIAGSAVVAVLILTAGFAAWAAQPASPVPPPAPEAPTAVVPVPPTAALLEAPPAPPAPSAPQAPPAPPAPPESLSRPSYPAVAVEQRVSGKVVLVVDVAADGRPTAVVVESAEPAGVFEAEAASAAWKWTFQPAIENGKPVASRVRVPVEFKIPPAPETAGEASNS